MAFHKVDITIPVADLSYDALTQAIVNASGGILQTTRIEDVSPYVNDRLAMYYADDPNTALVLSTNTSIQTNTLSSYLVFINASGSYQYSTYSTEYGSFMNPYYEQDRNIIVVYDDSQEHDYFFVILQSATTPTTYFSFGLAKLYDTYTSNRYTIVFRSLSDTAYIRNPVQSTSSYSYNFDPLLQSNRLDLPYRIYPIKRRIMFGTPMVFQAAVDSYGAPQSFDCGGTIGGSTPKMYWFYHPSSSSMVDYTAKRVTINNMDFFGVSSGLFVKAE